MAGTYATVRAGIRTMLDAFKTANASLQIQGISNARPPSFPGLPWIFIDEGVEQVNYTQGFETRVAQPSFVVVDEITDNEEVQLRMDAIRDALIAFLSPAYAHLIPETIWSRLLITGGEIDLSGIEYRSLRFTFADLEIRSGRS